MARQFSQKHYNAIAAILRERYGLTQQSAAWADTEALAQYTEGAHKELIEVVEKFSILFQKDSPKFDVSHFLAVVEGRKPLNSRP